MANQTITLPTPPSVFNQRQQFWYSTKFRGVTINRDLRGGDEAVRLNNLFLNPSATNSIFLDFSSDLSDAFETNGYIVVSQDDRREAFAMGGFDRDEPYALRLTGSDLTRLQTFVSNYDSTKTGTLELWDENPDPAKDKIEPTFTSTGSATFAASLAKDFKIFTAVFDATGSATFATELTFLPRHAIRDLGVGGFRSGSFFWESIIWGVPFGTDRGRLINNFAFSERGVLIGLSNTNFPTGPFGLSQDFQDSGYFVLRQGEQVAVLSASEDSNPSSRSFTFTGQSAANIGNFFRNFVVDQEMTLELWAGKPPFESSLIPELLPDFSAVGAAVFDSELQADAVDFKVFNPTFAGAGSAKTDIGIARDKHLFQRIELFAQPTGTRSWSFPKGVGDRIYIRSGLLEGTDPAYMASFSVRFGTGRFRPFLGRPGATAFLSLAPDQHDLIRSFESNGYLILRQGGRSAQIPMDGYDTSEPYSVTFFDSSRELSSHRAAYLAIRAFFDNYDQTEVAYLEIWAERPPAPKTISATFTATATATFAAPKLAEEIRVPVFQIIPIPLPTYSFTDPQIYAQWSLRGDDSIAIIAGLRPEDATATARITEFGIYGGDFRTAIRIDIDNADFRPERFSSVFEQVGYVVLKQGSNQVSIPIGGKDLSPDYDYFYEPPSKEGMAINQFLRAYDSTQNMTLELWDGEPPDSVVEIEPIFPASGAASYEMKLDIRKPQLLKPSINSTGEARFVTFFSQTKVLKTIPIQPRLFAEGGANLFVRFEHQKIIAPPQDLKLTFAASGTSGYAVRFTHNKILKTIEIDPDFTASGTADYSVSIEHDKILKTIPLEPLFLASGTAAYPVTLDFNRIVRTYQLRADFSASATADFDSDLEAVLHQRIIPTFGSSGTADFPVDLSHIKIIETIPISPIFAATGSEGFVGSLARKTPFIRPVWQAVGSGSLVVEIEHQKIIVPIREIDATFASSGTGTFDSGLQLGRVSIEPIFPSSATAAFDPRVRIPVVEIAVVKDGTRINDFPFGVGEARFGISLIKREAPPPPVPTPMVGWAADVDKIGRPAQPLRVWSGEGQLTLDGVTYEGTTFDGVGFASISPFENSVGSPQSRVTISMAVPSAAIRAMLNIDVGPVPVRVFNVVSSDGGRSWEKLPTGIAGRLSRPSFDLEGSVYTIEIETYSGDADRGERVEWSHENQSKQNAGTPDAPVPDQAFEFMRSYEKGVNINWPP